MENKQTLMDSYGRRFTYLRLSITDICNYQCSYCLPNGYRKNKESNFLSVEEIGRLAEALSGLGLEKIRLTGGEPTIRSDFLDIARRISSVEGIKTIALTTNGYQLPQKAKAIYEAGVRSINISIDSLRSGNFYQITGQDRLEEALEGVEECLSLGFNKVKINTVLLNELNSQEIPDFLSFVKHRPVSLRFIELMRTRDNQDYFLRHHLSGNALIREIVNQGWQPQDRSKKDGPAVEYIHPDYQGSIGLIAPYSKDFCASCNRLRVSSSGDLHLCLFGEGGISLRSLLASDSQKEELQYFIIGLMSGKGKGHSLATGYSGRTKNLAAIGG